MRILVITNASTERCGVRAYGEEMIAAIRRAGHTVDVWDGTYSAVVAHGYLPHASWRYDLLHLNWDPQAINHYLPEHFRPGLPPLSLFLHDVPPNSTCPVFDVARWRFGFEPGDGIQVVPEGIPPSPAGLSAGPAAADRPIIGVTGIRNDPGMAMVADACQRHGWAFNAPSWWTGGPWLSTDDEIRRLSRSSVNVCWYQTTGRGKSMAACFCLAARRPLVLSPSTMFSALWPYADEIFIGSRFDVEVLEEGIRSALRLPVVAKRAIQELAWDRVIEPVLAAWGQA